MAKKIRPGAVSSLRKQKAVQLDKIQSRQEKIETQLRAVVPEDLTQWLVLTGHSLFYDLFGSAKATCEVWSDEDLYGFKDLKEFARRFDKLKIAWKGVIKIRITRSDDYKITISLKAL